MAGNAVGGVRLARAKCLDLEGHTVTVQLCMFDNDPPAKQTDRST